MGDRKSGTMKIAFFVTEFPALSETFIINQIIGLKVKGHLVQIYSKTRPSSKMIHQTVINNGLLNCTFYSDDIPNSRFKKLAKLLRLSAFNVFNKNILTLIKAVFRNNSRLSVYDFIPFLDKPEYDIVHAHFGINGNYVTQLRRLGLFKKAKFITTFHGYDLNEVFAKDNFYADLFEDCTSFTVNSLHSKKKLVKLGCEQRKIIVLPAGLNSSLFKKASFSDTKLNEMRMLFVGRLIRLKGPHLFVKICKKLAERKQIKFTATIVGEGAMNGEVINLIEECDLKNVISSKGALTQEEVLHIMDHSDIFVLPGINVDGLAEAQGLVIQEAQAMQLPVIISDAGGMREGIIDGVTGFVVPENDINGFVEKIELLANDPDLRKKMGEEGRKFVIQNYDINKLNERLVQIYLN